MNKQVIVLALLGMQLCGCKKETPPQVPEKPAMRPTVASVADGVPPMLSPDEMLLRGLYHQIPPGKDGHGKAVWAFAQLHLFPCGKVYDVAWQAHQQGELLGTFVVAECHREGIGPRRDEKLMWKLHYQIRQKLENKKDPTPVDLYLLAQTKPVNQDGVIKLPENKKYDAYQDAQEKLKVDRLNKSAKGGFGESCAALGKMYQSREEYAKALKWFDRASKLGLAEGSRAKGFMLMVGQGVARDEKGAFAAATQAAGRMDAFAMVNLAYYYDHGLGTKEDKKQAQAWLSKAAESGHWIGRLEKGLALHAGIYGFPVDKKAGEQEFRKALSLQHREVIDHLAAFYAEGRGVDKNGKRAAHFAEAAFVQGSTTAAGLLAYLYSQGVPGLPKDEKLKEYWSIQSNPSFSFTLAESLEKRHPEVTKHLKELDPWSWE